MSFMTKLLLWFILMAMSQVVICLIADIKGETKELVTSSIALGMVTWALIDSLFSKGDTK